MTYLAELFTVSVSGTSRRNVLGAIAFEKNDCNFPWRRQPRRVRKKRKRQAQQQKNRRLRPAPPLCKNPDEDRFSLTVSFIDGGMKLARGRGLDVSCMRLRISTPFGCIRGEIRPCAVVILVRP